MTDVVKITLEKCIEDCKSAIKQAAAAITNNENRLVRLREDMIRSESELADLTSALERLK